MEEEEEEQDSDRKTSTFPLRNTKGEKERKLQSGSTQEFPGQSVRLDSVRGTSERSAFGAGTLEMFIKEHFNPVVYVKSQQVNGKKGLWRRKQLLKMSSCA